MITLLSDRLLIEARAQEEKKTVAGIVIPIGTPSLEFRQEYERVKVLAVGRGKWLGRGGSGQCDTRFPFDMVPGDEVLIRNKMGIRISAEDAGIVNPNPSSEYRVLIHDDVVGIVSMAPRCGCTDCTEIKI